ncbi:3-hydroxyacyl-CoA dehydrogenase NAD-binding domain-containing protein [Dinoroseobacter sp. S375]|uniref:3-hydroxyacyl-CoA dehydrogenase NAD-binding domain-containing protein n=1 Tax=Dinoroseobacter sp. S375 TaxID=3415136 RepID=UPI003C7E2086
MPGPVTTTRSGQVALVALDNPPVNAASHALRSALVETLHTLDADPQIRVIALYGVGRGFIAGADIREFGKPPRDPLLPEVCLVLERCATPVISVLHGATLGGGFEVALATHARVALPGALFGFPEVTLGILPGAGGTQRAPRLAGLAPSLELITTGRRIGAEEALELGLIDRICDGAPAEIALQMGEAVLAGDLATRVTGACDVPPDQAALEAARSKAAASPLFAPLRCVEAVAASALPLDAGLAQERALFNDCMASPQRAALIRAFFAERAVAKIPEAEATPRDIQSTGVLGAGTMGRGIAVALLMAGLPVTLVEPKPAIRAEAEDWIMRALDGAVARGKLSTPGAEAARAGLRTADDLSALAEVDLVIEAVFEDLDLKQEVFRALDATCKAGAILATNTSYLDIDRIAAATARPADVIGLHFFSPAHIMRLLEVVVARDTAPEVVRTGFALAKRLRKVAVRAGVCDGFIGNRMLARVRAEADALVLEGATPWEVDAALEAAGFAMGPFAVSDLAGLDIGQAGRQRRGEVAPVSDALCDRGWFGRKTGRGYYLHKGKSRVPNPDVTPLIDAARHTPPRSFTPEEITTRYLTAMAAEGAQILAEGIALRPIDIDAVTLFGYGFPRHLGGPMHWADELGLGTFIDRLGGSAPEILQQLHLEGRSLADLN